jgi:hypothetical protein
MANKDIDKFFDLYNDICSHYNNNKHASIESACKQNNISARYFYYICKRIGMESPAARQAVEPNVKQINKNDSGNNVKMVVLDNKARSQLLHNVKQSNSSDKQKRKVIHPSVEKYLNIEHDSKQLKEIAGEL